MRINYNVSAQVANKQLLGIENKLATSMERLSSGLKINHAKDNPAGMAISNKMKAQIDGLNRASQNASDGISVIQIADGALSEVTSILQRMRELSVQAASDATMSLEDKQAIQAEITSLTEEVDRISKDTEYNTRTLLDGSLDTRVYTDNASNVQISDHVEAGMYGITVTKAATQAGPVATNGTDFTDITTAIGVAGSISINGSSVEIEATDTLAEAYEKIRKAAEGGEVTADRDATGNISFTADAYGEGSSLAISFDNAALANKIGLAAADGFAVIQDPDTGSYVYGKTDGTDITVPTGTKMELSNDPDDWVGFSSTATAFIEGNKVTITDIGGFSMSFLVDKGYEYTADTDPDDPPVVSGEVTFEVTDIGTMTLHIGANKDQNMEVRIPEVSSTSLYIEGVDVTTVTGADKAITSYDKAIAQVSGVRSSLGAYENRLEHATSNLDNFEENMTGALSRLTDVDMAEEMTNYTHQNVLNQAAISVLTQANDMPQQVLQIMQ